MNNNKLIKDLYEIHCENNYSIVKCLKHSKYYRVSSNLSMHLNDLDDKEIEKFLFDLISSYSSKEKKDNIFFKKILSFKPNFKRDYYFNIPLWFMILTIILSIIFIFTTNKLEYKLNFTFNQIIINVIWIILNLIFHELGHIILCLSSGRKIMDYGIILNYGFPCFFVNTIDISMANMYSRIKTSLGGVWMNSILVIIIIFISKYYNYNIKQLIIISTSFILINLIPFMKLDGYYILQDLVGISNLSKKSKKLSEIIFNKNNIKSVFNKENIFLLIYRVLSLLFYFIIITSIILDVINI